MLKKSICFHLTKNDDSMKKARVNIFSKYDLLASEATNCTLCPGMDGRTAVLSRLNGNLTPKAFFIAEAPGRQGADRTRRPFYGDKSGENFERFLESVGVTRDEIFITNTVLCSPRSESGANRKPLTSEIKNCAHFLRRTIELLNPQVVVTLGAVALDATRSLERHDVRLKGGAGSINEWNERYLVPLYHPSPQVIAATRNFEQQLKDFAAVGEAIKAAESRKGLHRTEVKK
jgi:uracil-DNA glycosylase family 4